MQYSTDYWYCENVNNVMMASTYWMWPRGFAITVGLSWIDNNIFYITQIIVKLHSQTEASSVQKYPPKYIHSIQPWYAKYTYTKYQWWNSYNKPLLIGKKFNSEKRTHSIELVFVVIEYMVMSHRSMSNQFKCLPHSSSLGTESSGTKIKVYDQ